MLNCFPGNSFSPTGSTIIVKLYPRASSASINRDWLLQASLESRKGHAKMPAVSSATVFIHQSALLLQARPTTTKLTYSYNTSKKDQRGTLVVKTFDPISGACFRFRTRKVNDLNRILRALGGMAGVMAGTSSGAEIVASASGSAE
ncbi:signal recognition particle 9 kDa protein-domain-containing protein [Lipomyces kononenkoae]|uniref:Signal recognition particle 9 kDa protein-domain-containing protein n=1 Tax=Lipomyces kononenkoae TaxID=34357 RepID=A0ACC3T988_LIPKO